MWNLRWVPPWKKEDDEGEEEEAEKRSKVRGDGRIERDEAAIKGNSRKKMGLMRMLN